MPDPRETVTLYVPSLSRTNSRKLRRVLAKYMMDTGISRWSVGGRPLGPKPKPFKRTVRIRPIALPASTRNLVGL